MEGYSSRRTAIALRIIASLAFVGTIVVNALANLLPINGMTTGEVASLYTSLFTPAGITFSIWSVIYFLLLIFIVHSWVQREAVHITMLLPAFILTCVFNISWILAWHHLIPAVSVIIMVALLGTLIILFLRIQDNTPRRKLNIVLIILPFTIYLAWICVATIANVSAWLSSLPWNALGVGPQIWTVIMMGIAAFIGVGIFLKYKTPEFVAVVIWALLGIYLRWKGSQYELVEYGSLVLVLMLTALTVALLLSKRKVTR